MQRVGRKPGSGAPSIAASAASEPRGRMALQAWQSALRSRTTGCQPTMVVGGGGSGGFVDAEGAGAPWAERPDPPRRPARALSIVSRAERTMSSPSATKSLTTPTALPSRLRMRFDTDMPRRRAWSFSSVSSASGTRVWITRSFVLRSGPGSGSFPRRDMGSSSASRPSSQCDTRIYHIVTHHKNLVLHGARTPDFPDRPDPPARRSPRRADRVSLAGGVSPSPPLPQRSRDLLARVRRVPRLRRRARQ